MLMIIIFFPAQLSLFFPTVWPIAHTIWFWSFVCAHTLPYCTVMCTDKSCLYRQYVVISLHRWWRIISQNSFFTIALPWACFWRFAGFRLECNLKLTHSTHTHSPSLCSVSDSLIRAYCTCQACLEDIYCVIHFPCVSFTDDELDL